MLYALMLWFLWIFNTKVLWGHRRTSYVAHCLNETWLLLIPFPHWKYQVKRKRRPVTSVKKLCMGGEQSTVILWLIRGPLLSPTSISHWSLQCIQLVISDLLVLTVERFLIKSPPCWTVKNLSLEDQAKAKQCSPSSRNAVLTVVLPIKGSFYYEVQYIAGWTEFVWHWWDSVMPFLLIIYPVRTNSLLSTNAKLYHLLLMWNSLLSDR